MLLALRTAYREAAALADAAKSRQEAANRTKAAARTILIAVAEATKVVEVPRACKAMMVGHPAPKLAIMTVSSTAYWGRSVPNAFSVTPLLTSVQTISLLPKG